MSLKKSNNEFDKLNNISLYQNELALKDKQISHLKNKINNLILNKNSLISHLDKTIIKKKSLPSSKMISPHNNNSCKNNKIHSSIPRFELVKNLLTDKHNLSVKLGDKYRNTFQYKLLSAQKEIENLTIMNANKDNIIINMQKFINNLNNIICNGKINLNLNQLDIKTFFSNLKKLEQTIIKLIKIPKPNKIPQSSFFKKIKEKPIKKQNTEVSLIKKSKIYICPSNKRNYNNNLCRQISINDSKFSNNSYIKQNFTCQNYNYSKKKIYEWNDLMNSAGGNNSLQKKKNFKDALKFKKLFLLKRSDMYNSKKGYTKKHMNSLDNKYFNDNCISNNNEMSLSRLLSDNINGGLNKNSIDK